MTETRTKCPVPHEVSHFRDIVPLENCGLCNGTGYINPFQSAPVATWVKGLRVELVKTEALGMLWICECPLFFESTSLPPFCEHTAKAFERANRLKGREE